MQVDATNITTTAPSATKRTIPEVQGSGSASPYVGKHVTVSGVVTGIQRTGDGAGFFLQDPVGDGDDATSDGLYVRMGDATSAWQSDVSVGARTTASGIVSERGGLTAVEAASAAGIRVQRAAQPTAISALVLDVPVDPAARADYLEAREGMVATIPTALVVGPTNVYGQYIAVDADKHGARRIGDAGPDRTGYIHVNGKIGPKTQLMVGDLVTGMRGPIGVTNGAFEVQPVGNYKALERGPRPPRAFGDIDGDDQFTASDRAAIKARIGEPAFGPLDAADLNGDGKITRADVNRLDARAARITGAPTVRIATLNAFNFFDPIDAPAPIDDPIPSENEYRTKLAKLGGTIRDRLGAPSLLALQEVENTKVLDDLLERPELKGLGYQYVLLPTNGRRSINPALLYRSGDVEVLGARQLQQADRNGGEQRIFAAPDDRSAHTAAAPLFAREPLVVDVRLRDAAGKPGEEMTLVVNHLVSKFSPHGVPTDTVRVQQATFLRDNVEALRASNPEREVIVIGDLNDTPGSRAVSTLTGAKRSPTMVDAISQLTPEAERYSYIFDGRSELIDHVLVTPGLMDRVERAGVRHGNADLPRGDAWDSSPSRASDHDSPYIDVRRDRG